MFQKIIIFSAYSIIAVIFCFTVFFINKENEREFKYNQKIQSRLCELERQSDQAKQFNKQVLEAMKEYKLELGEVGP